MLGAREVLDQQPVAQPALAHADFRELQLLHQHVEHRRAGDDDVRALRVHARHAAPLLGRERAEQPDHLAQVLAAERVVLAPGPLAEEPRGDFRQADDGARRADGDVEFVLPQFLDGADADVADVAP